MKASANSYLLKYGFLNAVLGAGRILGRFHVAAADWTYDLNSGSQNRKYR